MKFSIAISTYNRLSLLKRAIDSALSQTISCEVVVADDCSDPETQVYVEGLMEQWGDRIIYHRNSVNSGHSATVNAAVKVASGDWIKFLDDDDYLAPNCIEEMEKAIALHPQAAIVSCQAAQVDLKEAVLSITRQPGPGKVFYVPQEDIHYGMLLEMVPFGTPVQVACRRDALIRSGGWDSSLDANSDDIDSWVKVAQFGDALFINQTLAYRTVWPGAYNKKIPIMKRLRTNLLIKTKIYHLVARKYRDRLPDMSVIVSYVDLHWGLAALKQRRILDSIRLLLPHFFSFSAWQLLLQAQLSSRYRNLLDPYRIDKQIVHKWQLYSETQDRLQVQRLKVLQARIKLRCMQLAWQQGRPNLAVKLLTLVLLSPERWLVSDRMLHSKLSLDLSGTSIESFRTQFYQVLQKKLRSPNPELKAARDRLRLRWGWVALQEGHLPQGLALIAPSSFSPEARTIVLAAMENRLRRSDPASVRKIVLVEL
ncbi:glycosyltransferase family 2 protein [Roseofilum casamattae]|uniref:Glycosyltransferase family 2 protein n=1 Tax=Roseofilum casamattae BLCC-M143 TaxID=3022442 RepID=A0ABT7C084_9CYAN|nr:glycosyltransferase family 2 protein [Roseofilum casamattae]MDJ1184831.1 glycosyltransferase family 2 protein [Roseofilum casamattae BLCC-M143]